ncbi:MAG TPA: ATP-dependent Clp protease adapter ClpS [Castellaniella sp.]|uniref:ATP-dependent Clp protease adapter ClpS n=1 Tax=Castellaniella sp. TaxID=1955812 RepID=UPI002F0D612C
MSTVIQNQRELKSDALPARLAPPPLYQVVLLNDDYTPMDFVVRVLEVVFHKADAEAERIMLQVHHQGRGICGIYTRDVAATRVDRVLHMAHAGQHPLQCLMEPVPAP